MADIYTLYSHPPPPIPRFLKDVLDVLLGTNFTEYLWTVHQSGEKNISVFKQKRIREEEP